MSTQPSIKTAFVDALSPKVVLDIDRQLMKSVPALTQEKEGVKFGQRGREWSWRWGYWGRAAANMFQHTGDQKFLDLLISAHRSFLALRDDNLGLTDDVRGRVMKSWGTIITGLHDRGLRTCEVETSGLMVLPWLHFLCSDQSDALPQDTKDEWLTTVTEVLDSHLFEIRYHAPSDGCYFMSPWFDHKVEPINHSHLIGAAYALAFKLTKNQAYKNAAEGLFRFFKFNWRQEANGCVSWSYNPTEHSSNHGADKTRFGDKGHVVGVGPELFYKASVTIELPYAMKAAGIGPTITDDMEIIKRSIEASVFLPDNKINYYISRQKRHHCDDTGDQKGPILRPHYMCAFILMSNGHDSLRNKIVSLVENRTDLFPRGWLGSRPIDFRRLA